MIQDYEAYEAAERSVKVFIEAVVNDIWIHDLRNPKTFYLRECLTAGCKAFSLANGKGTGTNDWVIKSLDD